MCNKYRVSSNKNLSSYTHDNSLTVSYLFVHPVIVSALTYAGSIRSKVAQYGSHGAQMNSHVYIVLKFFESYFHLYVLVRIAST